AQLRAVPGGGCDWDLGNSLVHSRNAGAGGSVAVRTEPETAARDAAWELGSMYVLTDLWLMSGLVFVPTIFACILLFFPKGSEEYMRWFTLLGTAITFVFSALLFIDYYFMLDRKFDGLNNRPFPSASLMSRVDDAKLKAAKNDPREDHDLVT